MAKQTEEERKAKKKAYMKAWYKANEEALKIKRKAYKEANKEALRIKNKVYNKAYHEANKANKKVYRKANKEKISLNMKAYHESKKLSFHMVYCLPNYNKNGFIAYAGVTDNPSYRMRKHRSIGKNTEDWFVLKVCKTRKEALEVEAQYHSKGYAGGEHLNKNKK